MSEKQHTPHKWEIIRIKTPKETFHKVLAEWKGGYLDSDVWRMSSVIKSIEETDDYYIFNNMSGSTYKCGKTNKSLGFLTSDIYGKMEEKAKNDDTLDVKLITIEELKENLNE